MISDSSIDQSKPFKKTKFDLLREAVDPDLFEKWDQ